MTRQLLTGNAAAACGVRLADVDYIPAFPITPQTEIIETLAAWASSGELAGRFVTLDSEHSMITAAGAAAATGARTFTATSSQGLLYGMEALYTISGWRVPLVLVNVSRGLSAPITLGPDHNDVLAARDAGFVQIHAETCQEVLDSILMGYRIAEDRRVSVPVIVNLDGFYLSFTREPVDVPDETTVREFLPPLDFEHIGYRATRPVAQGVAVLEGATYSHFRYQMHRAIQNAATVHAEVAAEFHGHFGRKYGAVEQYRMDDADIVLVMAGSFATKGKAAVDRWSEDGKRVGLLRLRLVRPFPMNDLATALTGRKSVGVIDQNLSPGSGGILHHELAASLFDVPDRPPVLRSFVSGLGGKDIGQPEFDHVLEVLESAQPGQGRHETELLMTSDEWQQVQSRLVAARRPVDEDIHPNTNDQNVRDAVEADADACEEAVP